MKTTFTEGLRARFAGAKVSDCPYQAETLDWLNWRTGWNAGGAPIRPYNVMDLDARRAKARAGLAAKDLAARKSR